MTAVRHRADTRAAEHRDDSDRRPRGRRALAVLAAFSVLGVGAGITTLAAWHQTLYLNGAGSTPIGASSFCVEESVDGSTFIAGTVNGASTALSFTPTNALALSPGDALFAFVRFRTCSTSTRAGLLSLTGVTGVTGNALAGYLTYGAVAAASSSACTASAFTSPAAGTLLAPATTALTATGAPSATSLTLPVGSGGTAGATVGVCFEVGLPTAPISVQGGTASPTWTFDAQSS